METQNLVEYGHFSHSVCVMMMHLGWKQKYAYRMFRKFEQKNFCSHSESSVAARHKNNCFVRNAEHVHCEVQVSLNISASKVLQILKGQCKTFFYKKSKGKVEILKRTFAEQRKVCILKIRKDIMETAHFRVGRML